MTRSWILLVALAAGGCMEEAKPVTAAASAPTPRVEHTAATPMPTAGAGPVIAAGEGELPTLVELARNDATRAQYPQADALVAINRTDITLQGDGTVVEHHKYVARILDAQRGKEKFADVHVQYDSKRQGLQILLARTVNADGSEHRVSPEEIGEIVPPYLAGATVYSGVLERVVSFPAVDAGSVVELEYTRTTRPSPDAAVGGEEPFAMWDPMLERTVTLTAPDSTKVSVEVEGSTVSRVDTVQIPGTHTYTWTEKNIPDRQPETDQPGQEGLLPRLLYSFLPDWSAALAKVAGRYDQASMKIAPPVQSQADTLTSGARTETERAQALFKFVAHDVRSVELPLGLAGYAVNAPEVVLANRYADARDKAVLLLALCAAEKIRGEAVLTRVWGVPVIAAVPTLAQFDRMLVRLHIGDAEVWLDPTDEDGQFGTAFSGQGNLGLALVAGAVPVRRPMMSPGTSTSHIEEALVLNEKGDLDAKIQFHSTGYYADMASAYLRPLKGDNLAQRFQTAAARVSAAATDAGHQIGDLTSVAGPIEITHQLAVPGYSPAQGRFRVFELPRPSLEFLDDTPAPGLSKRTYPLWVGTPRTLKRDIVLTLPPGWKVAYLPPELEGTASGLTYHTGCLPVPQTKGNKQTVACHSEITLDSLEVTPDQYAGFHDALSKVDEYRQRVLLLTR